MGRTSKEWWRIGKNDLLQISDLKNQELVLESMVVCDIYKRIHVYKGNERSIPQNDSFLDICPLVIIKFGITPLFSGDVELVNNLIRKFSDLTSEVYKTKTFSRAVIANFTVHTDYLHTRSSNFKSFWKKQEFENKEQNKETLE